MLLDPADFALQEQPEDNLMVAVFLGHGVMADKPYWLLSQPNPWNFIFNFVVSKLALLRRALTAATKFILIIIY